MNELREHQATPDDRSLKCECECFRVECGANFQITIDAYETARSSGRTFVVAPGHQSDDERILWTTATFFVIEKTGEQGRIADTLDPR